jgi:hypothetical protein
MLQDERGRREEEVAVVCHLKYFSGKRNIGKKDLEHFPTESLPQKYSPTLEHL